ncbi:MAG TPA: alkaline phosphatase D family protein [Frankiaceae bacterium]|nr:alkaline phosphatase D family protein [Frankiaceae bacterium]
MDGVTRRKLLLGSAAAAVLAGCSGPTGTRPGPAPSPSSPPPSPVPGVGDDAFSLGVASGDPLPDGVVLWTRLAPHPTEGGGMPDRPVPVGWEVAEDEGFGRMVSRGEEVATPRLAHSVHVDVRGLRPGREYFYRFRAGTARSPVGRTRTAPAPDASPGLLRLALANCQDFQNGYWPAYAAIARDDLDLVLHVGDYIYEGDPDSRFPDRRHTTPQRPGLGTLADYRNRYGQYKQDPALRAAHAAFPWVLTWDDHEVQNNYAGLVGTGEPPADFARRRAVAYQAYWEHVPIRAVVRPGSPDLRIYRRLAFGDLLTVSVLDTRQYRTDQPCGAPQDIGPASCGQRNTAGTLTGGEQEAWLLAGLRGSWARWNAIAQQTMMAQLHGRLGTGPVLANLDQYDGYVPYRSRLLAGVRDSGARNPVVLSGDLHSAWVNDLRVDFDRPETPVVATEFVATSISSAFFLIGQRFVEEQNRCYNPHVRYFNGDKRGYTRIEVTRGEWRAQMRVAQSIDRPDATVTTDATYVVEDGRPGAHRA